MNKNKAITLTFGIICTLACLLLLIFCVPESIPLAVDINEKIAICGSKYFLIILIILPLAFSILAVTLKSNQLTFIFKMLLVTFIYENVLVFIYLLTGTSFEIGGILEIPLSCFIFLPLSAIIMVSGIKLKNQPFDSKFGIRFKCTRETEFIWKQTHFFAKNVFFAGGFILFLISAIFSFFHLAYILLILFIILILVLYFVVYGYSRSMCNKYKSMKAKKDKIDAQVNKNK